ncbi:GNAT family N-acetyltransferase [Anaerosalibacter massiliensis]|uniref:GNAT family N-acetyltransferase n=1 Tax=Anaerosalibacter massiliensis TaxID=1347392 RepID=A0A9X2S7Z6_9FIRM|nr:N-acetyltransferase [Anaerosalibacter massiliensis]MCR2044551.1 GNAT family N-acetyltransferase [Anaerosalibacter massiliensis]
MIIRNYEKKDWKRLNEIHDEARKIELNNAGIPDAYLSLEETYENEGLFDYELLVAEDKTGLVVGFVAFYEEEIAWLYVDPKYHRKGIATKLLSESIEKAGNHIFIEVLENNIEAINLYKKMGFTVVEKKTGKMVGNESFEVTGYILEYKKQ